jgi:hypothetical protein
MDILGIQVEAATDFATTPKRGLRPIAVERSDGSVIKKPGG